ncbi:MAG: hypothetical protein JW976_14050 [Syntrophaceae bacterium]|nr:hypothetical protein [Syntrophaceae bacterium]
METAKYKQLLMTPFPGERQEIEGWVDELTGMTTEAMFNYLSYLSFSASQK